MRTVELELFEVQVKASMVTKAFFLSSVSSTLEWESFVCYYFNTLSHICHKMQNFLVKIISPNDFTCASHTKYGYWCLTNSESHDKWQCVQSLAVCHFDIANKEGVMLSNIPVLSNFEVIRFVTLCSVLFSHFSTCCSPCYYGSTIQSLRTNEWTSCTTTACKAIISTA